MANVKFQNKRGGFVVIDGKKYAAGEVFELTDEVAAHSGVIHALKIGEMVRVGKGGGTGGETPPIPPKPDENPAVAYKDWPEATALQIQNAVALLDPANDDQFTKVGGINVKALESILQEHIGTPTKTNKADIAEATKSDKNPNGADRVTLRVDAEDLLNAGKGGGTGGETPPPPKPDATGDNNG